MGTSNQDSVGLLERWYAGEADALEEIVRRNLPWVEGFVRKRLGGALRGVAETQDFVQEAMREFLRYGPRFRPEGEEQLRALLARIALNVIRDKHDWYTARRRDMAREQPLPSGTVLDLVARAPSTDRPSRVVQDREEEAAVRLALELLAPDDRRVVFLRQWEGLAFAAVGDELGVSEDAARMRFGRALARLGGALAQVRAGSLDELLVDELGDERPGEDEEFTGKGGG